MKGVVIGLIGTWVIVIIITFLACLSAAGMSDQWEEKWIKQRKREGKR